MAATIDELDARVDEVLRGVEDDCTNHPLGALVVYCGGCALSLETNGRLKNVPDRVMNALSHQPFLGLFTYGELGVDSFGCNRHANLMYTVLRFESD
mmetsp:Transcript_33364/g.45114  ORF Transcript_33364/g.45114 Transcript_33364/m.45114 type:complete len:97 (+) Transcript_33364:1794-2084(+)